MNETEVERLVVRMVGDSHSYISAMQQAQSITQGVANSMSSAAGGVQVFSKRIEAFGLQFRAWGAGMAAAIVPLLGVGGLLSTGMKAVGLAASTEATEMAFKSLIGNAELAQKTLKDLRQFAAETPFEQPEILAAAKQMIAFGESADNIVPTMRSLGDVASALEIPLGSLTYLFGTLKSQGRAMTVDINQFAMRGIPIWRELEAQLGKTNAEVREMVEKGQINFGHIEQAFKKMTGPGGQFFRMMEEQSKTLSGLFSTMKDNINMALTDIGTILVEQLGLKEIVGLVSEAAGQIVSFIKNLSPEVKQAATSFMVATVAVGGLITALVGVKLAITGIIALVGMTGPVGIALIGLFVTGSLVVGYFVNRLGGVGKTLKYLQEQATAAWAWLLPVRLAVVGLADTVQSLLTQAWNNLKAAVERAWEAMTAGAQINWSRVREVAQEAVYAIEFALLNIGRISDAVWVKIQYEVERVKNNMVHFWGTVIPALFERTNDILVTTFKSMPTRFRVAAAEAAVHFIDGLVSMFSAGRKLVQEFVEFHVNAIRKIPDFIKGGADAMAEFFLPGGDKNPAALGRMFGEMFRGSQKEAEKAAEDVGKATSAALQKGFVVPTREEGALEKKLREEWEQARDGLNKSFAQFMLERKVRDAFRAAFGGGDAALEDPAAAKGNKKIEETALAAAKAVQKLDQVLVGSAEAQTRRENYFTMLARMGRGGAAGNMAKAPDAVQTNSAEARARAEKSEKLLGVIATNTAKAANKPTFIVEAANLS